MEVAVMDKDNAVDANRVIAILGAKIGNVEIENAMQQARLEAQAEPTETTDKTKGDK